MNTLETFRNYKDLLNLQIHVIRTSGYYAKNKTGRLANGIFIHPKSYESKDNYLYKKEIEKFAELYNLDCIQGSVVGFYVGKIINEN